MYTCIDFKTKKALKEALLAGKQIRVYQPNSILGYGFVITEGTVYLEGPHYPAMHTWYAEATIKDGYITKVK